MELNFKFRKYNFHIFVSILMSSFSKNIIDTIDNTKKKKKSQSNIYQKWKKRCLGTKYLGP